MSYDDGSSEGGPKGSFETFKAEADVLFKQNEYQKAIQRYDTALELRPGEVSCLIARSKCHQELGNLDKANKDSDDVLKGDPNHVKAILQKAEVLYSQGDFETALVFFHRGKKIRSEIREFNLGIQKSTAAIYNAVGPNSGVELQNSGDLTYFYEAQQQSESESEDEDGAEMHQKILDDLHQARAPQAQQHGGLFGRPIQTFEEQEEDNKFDTLVAGFLQQYMKAEKQGKKKGYNKPGSRKEERKREQRPQSLKQDSKTIKELLGELYADREYLDNLLTDIDDNGAKTQTNEELRELAIEGLRYLNSRSEFWQQQKPMYSRKRDKEMREGARSRASSAGGSKRDKTQWVLNELEKIDEAQAKGDYDRSLKMSKKVMKELEKWSDDDIQNRQEVIANLHSCMGNSYLEKGEYKKAESEHKKDLEIANQHDIEDAKSRALDNLGRVYARQGQFEKAVDVWENKLPLAKSPLEKTWLYHEIGRCHLEMGNYEEALDYGERSLKAAEEADDEVWQLNATVLVAQAQVKCGEYQPALDSFEKALDMAKLQNDKQAENAIKKALDDVNKKIVKGIKDDEQSKDKDHGDSDSDAKTEDEHDQGPKTKQSDSSSESEEELNVDQLSEKGEDKPAVARSSRSPSIEHTKADAEDVLKLKLQNLEKDRKSTSRASGRSSKSSIKLLKEEIKANDTPWQIKVYTSDISGAGTDANVYIIIKGQNKDGDAIKTGKIELDNKGNNFESGKCDEFDIDSKDFDQIESVRVGHDGSGLASGWHLDHIELLNKSSNKKFTFNCCKWLDEDKDDKATERELTKDGVKEKKAKLVDWVVKVYTTDERGSGTNADVYVMLHGETNDDDSAQSDKINLDKKGNDFEAGNCDEFKVQTLDFKKVRKVVIGHDNSGSFAGWHLNRVELKSSKAGSKLLVFPCDQWLADDEGDKKIERELFEGPPPSKKKSDDGRRSASPGSDKSPRGKGKGQDKKDEKKDAKKEEKKDDKEEKENWIVRTYTTDMKGSGTDANVYLIIHGKTKDNKTAKSEKIELDNCGDNFESGECDEFEIKTLDFESVEKIRIGHDNKGMFAGWHLDMVELEEKSSGKKYTFQCDRWLADDEDDNAIERELKEGAKKRSKEPVEWKVKVYTTDKRGSGTDANVYLSVFGTFDGKDNVQSDQINLDNKGNNFESGNCDEFEIETKDYDTVTKIKIGHDNSGLGSGWHLEKVVLMNKQSHRSYTFPCDRWLDDGEDDKKIERELMVEADPKSRKTENKNKDQTKDSSPGKGKGPDKDKKETGNKGKGQQKASTPGKAKGHDKDRKSENGSRGKGHGKDSPRGSAKGDNGKHKGQKK